MRNREQEQREFIKLLEEEGVNVVDTDISRVRDLRRRDTTIGVTFHHTGVSDRPIDSHHDYHVDEHGWAKVGYHGQIRPNGNLELGRPIWARGAHAGNEANDTTTGFAFSGNMNQSTPTDAQYQTAIAIVRVQLKLYQKDQEIYGHKHWSATACPGDNTDLDIIRDAIEEKEDDPELTMEINNRPVGYPLKIVDGRTFVKLADKWVQVREFIEMIPEASISWDSDTRTVIVTIPE